MSGSESMMRAEDSRMPAQKAVDRPTGPAPMTVMSRTSSSTSGLDGQGGTVQRAEAALQGGLDARERRGVPLRVGRRLGPAQPLHEVEEVGRVVGFERDDELLVVEAERVARIEVDRRVLAPDADVLLHD